MNKMWSDGKLVLHIVDAETNYQNAIFIHVKSNQDLWIYFIHTVETYA